MPTAGLTRHRRRGAAGRSGTKRFVEARAGKTGLVDWCIVWLRLSGFQFLGVGGSPQQPFNQLTAVMRTVEVGRDDPLAECHFGRLRG